MEIITKTPGFQHIVEKSLMCLDRNSIAIFRAVNQNCRGITDCPIFYLKKLSQENLPQDLIENWKQLIKKIPSEEIKQILTSEFIQMYAKRSPKYPLELAQELALDQGERSCWDLLSKFWEFLKIHFLLLTDAPHEEFASANPALDKKDSELLMFIFEFSSPKIFVKPTKSILSGFIIFTNMVIGNLNPIQIATCFGYEKAVERMISKYDDPNAPNSNGLTPIQIAAFKGSLKIVQLLIPSATNPHVANIYGWTPIHLAAYNGHLEIVRLLMTSTTNLNVANIVGKTPILYAAFNGHLEIVQLLMTSITNPNVADNRGWTPINAAAQEGHLDIVRLLMRTTDNPNAPDNSGWTPIHSAAQGGHLEIVRLLMKTTNNPNAPDNLGNTPEFLASELWPLHHDIVRLFWNN